MFTGHIWESVAVIVDVCREPGDEALFEYTARFERLPLDAATVEVTAG